MIEYLLDKSTERTPPTKDAIQQERERQLAAIKAVRKQLMQTIRVAAVRA